MKKYILLVFLLVPLFSQGQLISTVAGGGSIFPPNGSSATSCVIGACGNLCFDKFGNLYIESSYNYIYKMNTSGSLCVFAGTGTAGYGGDNGPATNALIHYAAGIVSDSKGNIFIADQNNQRIRKIDLSGTITTFAGTGVLGYSGDNEPATNAQLYYPSYLAIDSFGNIYLDERGKYTIRKIDTLGIITTICGTPGISGYSGDNGPASSALLSTTNGMHVDYYNNLYFCDNGYIKKIELSTGILSMIGGNGGYGFGGDNGPATDATFAAPLDVIVDKHKIIYISDWHNNRIRQVDTLGIITTIIGNGIGAYNGDNIPASSAEIWLPYGMCLDSCGNLYITDGGNVRVRKVTFDTSCHFYGSLSAPIVSNEVVGTIEVVPNPSFGEITITSNGSTIKEFYLTNMTGKLLLRSAVTDETIHADISALPSGLYFLHVKRKDGDEVVKKVLKD